MRWRHLPIGWAVLVVISTAVVFLCPAASGPFTAVNGPATTLSAWRFAANILCGMALAVTLIRALMLTADILRRPACESLRISRSSSLDFSCRLRC